jgi:WXG100 family type VII secretion target
MSKGFISIDYLANLKQAQDLELVADGCVRYVQELDRQMQILDAAWDGDASESFKDKIAEYRSKNINTQNEIRSTVSAIRQIVQTIKAADEAAAQAAAAMESGFIHAASTKRSTDLIRSVVEGKQ